MDGFVNARYVEGDVMEVRSLPNTIHLTLFNSSLVRRRHVHAMRNVRRSMYC
jgi:hypothetical protein